MFARRILGGLGIVALSTFGANVDPKVLDACSGYKATNVKTSGASLTADLTLNGKGCAVFGPDVQKLSLKVVYETSKFSSVVCFTCPGADAFQTHESISKSPTLLLLVLKCRNL